MDPLSLAASILAVITATGQTAKSLCAAVKRYKGRDKTLQRLEDGVQDLVNILDSLKQLNDLEASMLALLHGPIERCGQVCDEFEKSLESFGRKSKPGLRDWARMEFKRGDINEFIDVITGYKSTISVGIGTITLRTSKVSQNALEEYVEFVKDTVYNLEVHLQRIDEKMTIATSGKSSAVTLDLDLRDERAVTNQCLRVCEDAKSYIESLARRDPTLLETQDEPDDMRPIFHAQRLTREGLDKSRQKFIEIIGHIGNRLETLVLNEAPIGDEERLRLQDDIRTSKQCLEICKVANEVSSQKIYRVGEVVADGDCDQVVLTTVADLFDVKKAMARGRSAQLVGSMTSQDLQTLAEKRYSSRFMAVPLHTSTSQAHNADSNSQTDSDVADDSRNDDESLPQQLRGEHKKPTSNEMRKRSRDGST